MTKFKSYNYDQTIMVPINIQISWYLVLWKTHSEPKASAYKCLVLTFDCSFLQVNDPPPGAVALRLPAEPGGLK